MGIVAVGIRETHRQYRAGRGAGTVGSVSSAGYGCRVYWASNSIDTAIDARH
jgi:hypothetical protein